MNVQAKNGGWSTGLCGCCDAPGGCGTCCYSTCCGPCLYGQIVERMPSSDVCCGTNCCGGCCCFYLLGGFIPTVTAVVIGLPVPLSCSCFIHMGARGWIRNKYGIPGGGCEDCLITTFCIPCALCQEHRELVIRNVGIGGQPIGSGAAKPAAAPQQQVMQPTPPPQAYPGYPPAAPAPAPYGAPAYPYPGAPPPPPPPAPYYPPAPAPYPPAAPAVVYAAPAPHHRKSKSSSSSSDEE